MKILPSSWHMTPQSFNETIEQGKKIKKNQSQVHILIYKYLLPQIIISLSVWVFVGTIIWYWTKTWRQILLTRWLQTQKMINCIKWFLEFFLQILIFYLVNFKKRDKTEVNAEDKWKVKKKSYDSVHQDLYWFALKPHFLLESPKLSPLEFHNQLELLS